MKQTMKQTMSKYSVGSKHKNKWDEEYEIVERDGKEVVINFLPDGPRRTFAVTSLTHGYLTKYPKTKKAGALEAKKQENRHKNKEQANTSSSNPYFYYMFSYEFDIISQIMKNRGEEFILNALRKSTGKADIASLDYIDELAFKDEFKAFYKRLIEADTIENIIETMRERKEQHEKSGN